MRKSSIRLLSLISLLFVVSCQSAFERGVETAQTAMPTDPVQALVEEMVLTPIPPTATSESSRPECETNGIPTSDGKFAYSQVKSVSCYNVEVLHAKTGDLIANVTISFEQLTTWSGSPQFWLITAEDGTQFWLNLLDMREPSLVGNLVWNGEYGAYQIEGREVPELYIFPTPSLPGP